jgi:putative addiction module component (TIGR02574 family)
MTQIEKTALDLPPAERAQLVDKLWDSLGDTSYPILSPEWQAEIERRRRDILEGLVTPVAGEDVSRKAWKLAQKS